MIGILTWVAEREREMLVQRTKDGMRRAKRLRKSGRVRPVKVIDKNTLIKLLCRKYSKRKRCENFGHIKSYLI